MEPLIESFQLAVPVLDEETIEAVDLAPLAAELALIGEIHWDKVFEGMNIERPSEVTVGQLAYFEEVGISSFAMRTVKTSELL